MVSTPSPSKKGGGSSLGTAPNTIRLPSRFNSTNISPSENLRKSLSSVENKVSDAKFDRVRHKDTKRSHIALVFVYGYIIMVLITVICAPIYNAIVMDSPEPIDIERILAQIGSLIGAPLGFVIGYYFKEDK